MILAMSPFPPSLQQHLRPTLLTVRRASIHSLLPHLTTTTTTTPTTALGHPALPPLGNYHHPLSLGNAQYTPSTSRSGTRTVRLARCMLRRSTNKGLFVNSTRSISFTSSPVTTIRLTRCSHYGLPLKHGGTPFQPTWTSSPSNTTPTTVPAAAKNLATLLFGSQAADQLTSSGATSSTDLPDLTSSGIYNDAQHVIGPAYLPGDPTS